LQGVSTEVQAVDLNTTCVGEDGCRHGVTPDEAAALIARTKKPIWVHVNVTDRAQAERWLTQDLGFHELAVEDALSTNERPALTEYDDYLFLVLPAIHRTNAHEEYVEIAFFLKKNALVSVCDHECSTIQAWFDRWSKQHFPNRVATADILHMVVDSIVDGYLPVIDKIEDEIDDIADDIFTGDRGKAVQLIHYKRRLLEMRRRSVPLRDVINGLLRRDLSLIPEHTRPYLQDVYDHAARVNESIDLQRDTLTTLLDVHLSAVSNNLNEVMKKMTVIATVLMTAALIAGIYGMNFKYMPELGWVGGYPFALALMAVVSGVILAVFKKKNWL
jgi:magnesium transporter